MENAANYVTRDKIVFTASLVVLPIDDFTGQPVTGSVVRVYIPCEKPALIKPDGYRVFLNLTNPSVDVHCESGIYNEKIVTVDLGHEEGVQLVQLRLTPNASYPIPSGTTCIAGCGRPGTRVMLHSTDADAAFRLLYEYKCGEEEADCIHLYNPSQQALGGKSFFIQSKDKKQSEYFTVAGDEGEGCYRLLEPLKADYKKIGTLLFPVYEGYVGERGEFFLPVAGAIKPQTVFLLQTGSGEKRREIELTAGKINRVDL